MKFLRRHSFVAVLISLSFGYCHFVVVSSTVITQVVFWRTSTINVLLRASLGSSNGKLPYVAICSLSSSFWLISYVWVVLNLLVLVLAFFLAPSQWPISGIVSRYASNRNTPSSNGPSVFIELHILFICTWPLWEHGMAKLRRGVSKLLAISFK